MNESSQDVNNEMELNCFGLGLLSVKKDLSVKHYPSSKLSSWLPKYRMYKINELKYTIYNINY